MKTTVRRIALFISVLLFLAVVSHADDLQVNANQSLAAGIYTYGQVSVSSGATLTLSGAVTINASAITVDAGGAISGDGHGSAHDQGPGKGIFDGNEGSGGGYGGSGGSTATAGGQAFGSPLNPVDLGSGGGGALGGSGGGAVVLNVSRALTLNGRISVNGNNGAVLYGGGSGGSVLIAANTITGSGTITANGGNSGPTLNPGGGSGGRIALHYTTSAFNGSIAANGGTGAGTGAAGQPGTICYLDVTVPTAPNLAVGPTWDFSPVDAAAMTFGTITLDNTTCKVRTNVKANTLAVAGSTVTVADGVTLTVNILQLGDGSNLAFTRAAVLIADDLTVSGTVHYTGNLNVSVQNLSVGAGSVLSADGMGSPAGQGLRPGADASSGGGHGGVGGGAAGGGTYDDAFAPIDDGSGGGGTGGAGGGTLQIFVANTFTLSGRLSASGLAGQNTGGGGAGGSIYVTTSTFAGTGVLAANGGAGWPTGNTGGGGGGRVAVYFNSSTFTGTALASGGAGQGTGTAGGDGTVVLYNRTVSSPQNLDLTVNTTLDTASPVYDATRHLMQLGTCNVTGVQATPISVNINCDAIVDTLNVTYGTVTVADGMTLRVATLNLGTNGILNVSPFGQIEIGNLTVGANAQLNANAAIHVDNLTIPAGSSLSADAKGFAPGEGPGTGATRSDYTLQGAGGSYGGPGSALNSTVVSGPTYGSATQPIDKGSGGGGTSGGYGGGALRIVVANTLIVNGVISANGGVTTNTTWSGTGSGGSVYITTNILVGAGHISANAGSATYSNCGGGGRVAVYCQQNLFMGVLEARGGTNTLDANANGQAGTVGVFLTNTTGAPDDFAAGHSWSFLASDGPFTFGTVTLAGTATETSQVTIAGDLTAQTLVIGNANVSMADGVTVDTPLLEIGGNGSLSLAPTAALNVDNLDVTGSFKFNGNLALNVQNLTIDANSTLSADAEGFAPGQGPGVGATRPDYTLQGAGGSYGGLGSALNSSVLSGPIYGSATQPVDKGSGGGGTNGGYGGGALRLVVANTLIVNGAISANGGATTNTVWSGAGSGGSIYITTNTFTGAGHISANGGSATYFNCGGGGRVAVYCQQNTFTGILEARGGTNSLDVNANGQAGTVGVFLTNTTGAPNDFTVGHSWSFLPVDAPFNFGTLTLGGSATETSQVLVDNDITAQTLVIGNAHVTVAAGVTLSVPTLDIGVPPSSAGSGSLSLAPTAMLDVTNFNVTGSFKYNGNLALNVQNLTIDASSTLSADAEGFAPGQGLGAGATRSDYTLQGAGGSYGGLGSPLNSSVVSGPTYGSATEPVNQGSGGGGSSGGYGGGTLRLVVADTLIVNGAISANGGVTTNTTWSGTGSGGSVYITTNTFIGAGRISADGGSATYANCGGGGRVAVYCQQNLFTGILEARGGTNTLDANASGLPGTSALFVDNPAVPGQVDLYTGNNWRFEQADSPFTYHQITVANGTATAADNVIITAGQLAMGDASNDPSSLILSASATLNAADFVANGVFTLTGNLQLVADSLTIPAGAVLSADGLGFGPGQGPGAGASNSNGYGAGGSHGGRGVDFDTSTLAGPTYDSAIWPSQPGSGGGGVNAGGGGGVIELTVHHTLIVNGTLRANGANSTSFSGAGAGGAININAATLIGNGTITASGGNTQSGSQAGGGGCVAIFYNTNTFSGSAVANGGLNSSSVQAGQNGTVRFISLTPAATVATGSPQQETLQPAVVQFYEIQPNPQPGQGLLITVTPQSGTGLWELTGRHGGALPGNDDRFNATGPSSAGPFQWFDGAPDAGPYYLGVYYVPPSPPVAGDSPVINILATFVDEYAQSISTTQGANTGSVEVTLTGIGFSSAVQIALQDDTGATALLANPTGGTATSMTATLDLRQLAPGNYSIVVIWPDGTQRTLSQTFTVEGSGSLLRTLTGHAGGVIKVAFSPDGQQILSTSEDTTARLWDANTGAPLKTFTGHTARVKDGAFSPDGTKVLTGSFDNTVRLWDIATGNTVETFSNPSGIWVGCVAYAPDGKQVMAGYGSWEAYGFDVATGSKAVSYSGHVAHVQAAEYFVDGTRLLTGGDDGTARLWDRNTGGQLAVFTHMGVTYATRVAVDFSPDGSRIVTGAQDGLIHVWDVGTGQQLLTINGHGGQRVNSVKFSPDGNWLLSASDDATAKIWNADRGGAIMTLSPQRGAIVSAAFSPDGTLVVTGHTDGTVGEWLSGLRAQAVRQATPLTLSQTASGEVGRFRFADYQLDLSGVGSPGAGGAANLVVRMTPTQGSGAWRLLGRIGDFPTLAESDWSTVSPGPSGAYELLIPAPVATSYLFSVYYSDWSSFTPGQFTISCQSADHYLSSINVASGGNSGSTTVQVSGLGFVSGCTVELHSSSRAGIIPAQPGQVLKSFTPSGLTSTWMTVTMDLTGLAAQVADVVVVWPDTTTQTLTGAFTITATAIGPRLEAHLEVPGQIRDGRVYTLWLEYANTGDQDMAAPLFIITNPQNLSMRVLPTDPWRTDAVMVLGIAPDGDPARLAPGESNRIPIYFQSGGTGTVVFELAQLLADNTTVPWDTLEADMQPPGMSATDWSALWPLLTPALGSTWADYLAVLGADAERLAGRGEPAYSLAPMLDLESSIAQGQSIAAVSGQLTDADSGKPIVGANINARMVTTDPTADSAGVFTVVTTDSGQFSITGLPDGAYELYAEGYYFDTTYAFSIANQQDVSGVLVQAHVAVTPPYPQPQPAFPGHRPALASDGKGNAYLVWENSNALWSAQWSEAGGGAWSAASGLPGPANGANASLAYGPTIAAGGPGLAAVWEFQPDPAVNSAMVLDWSLGQITATGIQWSVPAGLTSDTNDDSFPTVVLNATGQPLALWLQRNMAITDDTDLYSEVISLAKSAPIFLAVNLDQPSRAGIIPAQQVSVDQMTPVGWPEKDGGCVGLTLKEGTELPKWVPVIGGKYGFKVNAQVCGIKDCKGATLSGTLGVTVDFSDNISGNGSITVGAKWKADPILCQYIFDHGYATLTVGAKGKFPTTILICVVGAPVGTAEVIPSLDGSLSGTLEWDSNFPGFPTGGAVDLVLGGGITGRITLLKGLAKAEVTGQVHLAARMKPPMPWIFLGYCAEVSGEASALWGLAKTGFDEKWGNDCPPGGKSLELQSGEPVITVTHDTYTVEQFQMAKAAEDVQIASQQTFTISPLTGTGNVYEGTPVLANVAQDLFDDGRPALAQSAAGESLVVWTKDTGNYTQEAGAKVVAASNTDGTWQAPVEIDGTAGDNEATSVVFDSAGNALAVWAHAATTGLNQSSAIADLMAVQDRTDIWYSIRRGGVWSAPAPVAELAGRDEQPALAAGPNGEVLAVWTNIANGLYSLVASAWNGQVWAQPVTLSTSVWIEKPVAAYLGSRYMVIWAGDIDQDINTTDDWRLSYVLGTWGSFSQAQTMSDTLLTGAKALTTARTADAARTATASAVQAPTPKVFGFPGAMPSTCCMPPPPGQTPNAPRVPVRQQTGIPTGRGQTQVVAAQDPNEKTGTPGTGTQHYVLPGATMDYLIYFQNKPDAAVPAQEVFVTDYLDPGLDLNSLEIVEFGWGDQVNPVPAGTTGQYSTRVTIPDWRGTTQTWWLDMTAALDPGTGRLDFAFHTLDPSTGALPTDVNAGFLPPDDSTHRGEGHVALRIHVRPDAKNGTQVTNQATITFDVNAPISTNQVANTIGQPNNPPVLTDPGNQTTGDGAAASLLLQATDPDPNTTLTYTVTGLPPGLSYAAATGLISGQVTKGSTGQYVVTASVSDGELTDMLSFYWTITPPTQYTLAYAASANGTISGVSPQTVNAGASGTAVTAVPNTGYHLVQWSDGSTQNPRTDTNVTANISVTASFAQNPVQQYTLTYTAGANGTISGVSPQTVNAGANGTAVTAMPSAGNHFVQWSDSSTQNPRTDANVTANISVTASFAPNPVQQYTLIYTAGANGTISGVSPQTVNAGASGTAVTAMPSAGNHFVQWSDSSTQNPRTDANVTANVSVTASFAPNPVQQYTLTYTAGANGTISGVSPQTVNAGASGTAATAMPSAGYYFVQWSDSSTQNPRTDTNVMANISVTASFAQNSGEGEGEGEGEGGSLQVTISPAAAVTDGAQWRVDGGAWQNSGVTLPGLTPGQHTIDFNTIAPQAASGCFASPTPWTTPASQTVTILPNQTTTATAAYAPAAKNLAAAPSGLNPAGDMFLMTSTLAALFGTRRRRIKTHTN